MCAVLLLLADLNTAVTSDTHHSPHDHEHQRHTRMHEQQHMLMIHSNRLHVHFLQR